MTTPLTPTNLPTHVGHDTLTGKGEGGGLNSLALLIQDLNLDSTRVLNALQNHGIISDLCVTAEDVGGEDRLRAVNWVINRVKKRPGNA